MSAEQTKSLMEKRAELEKQLQSLTDRGDALYTPGRSIISDQPQPIDEQTARLLAGKHLVAEFVAVRRVERGEGGWFSSIERHHVRDRPGLVRGNSDRTGLEGKVGVAERLARMGDFRG